MRAESRKEHLRFRKCYVFNVREVSELSQNFSVLLSRLIFDFRMLKLVFNTVSFIISGASAQLHYRACVIFIWIGRTSSDNPRNLNSCGNP